MAHHHHHHPTLSGKKLLITILLNVLITGTQIIGGIISGSLALITDAVHNLSDVISLIVSYVANILANKKKQTLKQTFGFKRAEIIAAFVNSLTLIIIAVFLGYEAIERLGTSHKIQSDIVIWLALLGIAANGFSVLLLKKNVKDNLNMKSAYIHLFMDMLTSIAVLIGGLLMKFFDIYWVDSILTLIIAIYLLFMSWNILIDSLKILMLFAPNKIVIKDIETILCKLNYVKNIHHVHIWQLNNHDIHFEAHIEFYKNLNLSDFDKICEEIEDILWNNFKINHCNLQPEFHRDDSKEFIIQD